jgi:hypothetical protein
MSTFSLYKQNISRKSTRRFGRLRYLTTVVDGTHKLLVYTDDFNLSIDNTNSIRRNTEALLVSLKEVRPDVKAEKIKYIFLFRPQGA